MSVILRRSLLLALAALLLLGSSQVQSSLNRDRDSLGLTRVAALENAPPVLAFTTLALGGFRGLISNALWIRANDLQDEDKFFEMAQLAEWITKLEPTFVQVWLFQGWNLAYNISVKFKDYGDRWRWVYRGIRLLRDDGLRFNPNETLIYRELAWFFQHKMGANLDDANMYYKQQWSREMTRVFGRGTPNVDELIDPKTPDQRERAALLVNEFKMDPKVMKRVNEQYGPLEWRLPEAHAIYWAAVGLEKAAENPAKVNPMELINLRRVVYQSLQLSFQRGKLVENPFVKGFTFGPNLDIIPKVSAAYERAANEDKPYHDHILAAHRNFLRDAVYFLYENNRVADAAYWFGYLCTNYPNKSLLDGTDKRPGTLTLDEYAFSRVQEDATDSNNRDRVKATIEGFLIQSYTCLTLGENDRAAGFARLAEKLHESYSSKTRTRMDPLKIEPIEDIKHEVLSRLLDPNGEVPFVMRAALRTRLGMGPEENPPPEPGPETNSAPEKVSSR